MKKYLSLVLVPLACAALLTGGALAAADPDAIASSESRAVLDLNDPSNLPDGVLWEDGAFTVAAAGVYRLSGSLMGRLTVDADGPVELILDGVSLTGPEAVQVQSKDPVTITNAPGSNNLISDGAAAPDGDGDPALFSKAPLVIGGEGTLSILAGADNGVRCKDGLSVTGGTVIVTAENNGLKVTGDFSVTGGSLTVNAGGDAIASEASRLAPGGVAVTGGRAALIAGKRGIDAEGAVLLSDSEVIIASEDDGIRADTAEIAGGTLDLEAGCDGIQTVTALTVSDGELTILTGGGGGNAISHPGESFGPWAQTAEEDAASAKGLKSEGDIRITGGLIDLSTADDSVHCGQIFTMDNGSLSILSGDDAIHADDMLVINGGFVNITDCFEGLEAFAVELRGGDVVIRAVNDGINANGREMMFGRGSSELEETEPTSASGATTTYVLISGGTLDLAVTGTMSNMGDGVDSNGAVYITGGVSVVSTYGTFMENGLDTGWGGPVVTGGAVIAGGSSTMAEGFSSDSTQCSAVVSTGYMPDGTEVVLADEAGNEIWSVTLRDGFSCLQISHPALEQGHVYTLTYGGQTTTLDFTETNRIESARGFGGPGGRPF